MTTESHYPKTEAWIRLASGSVDLLRKSSIALIVVVVVFLLLFRPDVIATYTTRIAETLRSVGVQKITFPGAEFQLAGQIDDATRLANDINAGLGKLEPGKPVDATLLSEIKQGNAQLSSLLKSSDSAVKTNIAQSAVANGAVAPDPTAGLTTSPAAPQSAADSRTGYMFLGRRAAGKEEWVAGSPQTIVRTGNRLPATGDTVTISTLTYLRNEPKAGTSYSSAATKGILREGQLMTILDLKASPAISGGDFIWAKVRPSD